MKNQFESEGREQNALDTYFKNALQNYQVNPPDKTWIRIKRKLLVREILNFNFSNISKTFLFTSVAGITLLALLLYFYQDTDSASTNVAGSALNNFNSATQKTSSSTYSNSVQNLSEQPVYSSVQTKTETSEVVSAATKGAKFSGYGSAGNRTDISHPETPAPEVKTYVSEIASSEEKNTADILKIEPFYNARLSGTELSFGNYQSLISKPSSRSFFSAAFDVTPEMTKYSSGKEFTWWTSADMTYHFSRFTLTSGVAYGYSTTEAKYRINYRSNDSIGYFTSIISFYLDPENPENVIFNTKNTTVYDSIDHLKDDRARSRYSYLRVPLLFGFDLLQTSRFTLNLHAGPAVTFMISEKKAAPYIDFPNSRIIRIDENEPARISTGWQIWTGLHLDYQLTPAFSVYAEPSFKYYLKTEYMNEETSTEQPWSAGLGIGIQYNFGKKH